tara:strand:+ start:296 stop:463 length:168 start_codon:yes stop_codon:yes gene_type:complete
MFFIGIFKKLLHIKKKYFLCLYINLFLLIKQMGKPTVGEIVGVSEEKIMSESARK